METLNLLQQESITKRVFCFMIPKHIHRIQAWSDSYQGRGTPVDVNTPLSFHKYIGFFCKTHTFAITLDIDMKGFDPENYDIPLPNWITRNPASGHCHAVWFIEGIVSRNGGKAENFLNSVSHKLAKIISKSNCTVRNNNATQNPFHQHWQTTSYHTGTYNLTFLAESIGLNDDEYMSAKKSRHMNRNLGRNCAVFYDCVGVAIRKQMGADEVRLMVEQQNEVVGTEFGTGPLGLQEVKSISKSITRYVCMHANKETRTKRSCEVRRAHNPNTAAERAKKLGMSKSSFYAKKLNTLVVAVKHALDNSLLDTTSGMYRGKGDVTFTETLETSDFAEEVCTETGEIFWRHTNHHQNFSMET